jgi:ribonuclease R
VKPGPKVQSRTPAVDKPKAKAKPASSGKRSKSAAPAAKPAAKSKKKR